MQGYRQDRARTFIPVINKETSTSYNLQQRELQVFIDMKKVPMKMLKNRLPGVLWYLHHWRYSKIVWEAHEQPEWTWKAWRRRFGWMALDHHPNSVIQ